MEFEYSNSKKHGRVRHMNIIPDTFEEERVLGFLAWSLESGELDSIVIRANDGSDMKEMTWYVNSPPRKI